MKKRTGLRRIVIIIAAVVLVLVCALLLNQKLTGAKADKVQNELLALKELGEQNAAPAAPTAQPGTNPVPGTPADDPAAEPAEPAPVFQEDFRPLYDVNDDLIGWVTAGRTIDYPVVCYDNDYYLRHNFYDRWDSNGTLFLDVNNELYPRDDVLLIHGHNMKSGAMFGNLSAFMQLEYMSSYPIVTFRTIYDEADVYYTPVAVFNASMKTNNPDYFDITQWRFKDDPDSDRAGGDRRSAEYRAFLDDVTGRSLWEAKTDVNENDKLLILSTCSYFQSDGRLLLVCRALREDETPEMIAELYGATLD